MKNLRSGLYIVAFAFLICVCTAYNAPAQDDGPVPWCNEFSRSSSSIPWCNAGTPEHALVHNDIYRLSQITNRALLSHNTAPGSNGSIPRFNNSMANQYPSPTDAILSRYTLFADRRQEVASIRS